MDAHLAAESGSRGRAVMIEDGLICNNAPDDDALAACRALGEKAAK